VVGYRCIQIAVRVVVAECDGVGILAGRERTRRRKATGPIASQHGDLAGPLPCDHEVGPAIVVHVSHSHVGRLAADGDRRAGGTKIGSLCGRQAAAHDGQHGDQKQPNAREEHIHPTAHLECLRIRIACPKVPSGDWTVQYPDVVVPSKESTANVNPGGRE